MIYHLPRNFQNWTCDSIFIIKILKTKGDNLSCQKIKLAPILMKIGISSNSGMPSSILMSKIFHCRPFSKWPPFFRQLQLDPILMKICMQGKSGMTSLILIWKSQVSDSGSWEPLVYIKIRLERFLFSVIVLK